MLIKSYRLRLALGSFFSIFFLIMLLAYGLYSEYRGLLIKRVDEKLLKWAKVDLRNDFNRRLESGNEEVIKKMGDQYYQVTVRGGKVIVQSVGDGARVGAQQSLNRKMITAAFQGMPQYETFDTLGEAYRGIYYAVDQDSVMHSWVPLKEVEDELMEMEKIFMHLAPFFLAAAAFMSWYVAGRAIAPVVKVTSLAEQIRNGRLTGRIDVGLKGREIDDLVAMVNEMLDNIQRSVETQKRFTSDVSHEIRSPLTSLRGSMEVALRRKRTPEEYQEMLRNNLSDVIRLSRITDNLLFLTKADNNIIELRMQWFDLNNLMVNIVEQLRYKAETAGVSIEEDYKEHLEAHGDIFLLEQAFSNLVENAIKYTPEGGRIVIKTADDKSSVLVRVGDTGIGIPEGDIPHVFERFYRVNKERSRKLGGTGLGLSITEWIVNAHHGKIYVESKVGEGSQFTVALPKTAD